jgi:hypothetical protein
LLVLHLLVSFEGDPIDRRILGHGDDQLIAGTGQAHVGEQAGGIQRLERDIEVGGCEMLAVPGMEIRPDRGGLDPLITLDPDDGLRPCRGKSGQGSAGKQACRDDAAGRQPIGA